MGEVVRIATRGALWLAESDWLAAQGKRLRIGDTGAARALLYEDFVMRERASRLESPGRGDAELSFGPLDAETAGSGWRPADGGPLRVASGAVVLIEESVIVETLAARGDADAFEEGALLPLDLDPARYEIEAWRAKGVFGGRGRLRLAFRLAGDAGGEDPAEIGQRAEIELEIDGELDLHGIAPHEARDVIEAYLDAAREKGLRETRIIHGKGIGAMKDLTLATLERRDDVVSYQDAPLHRGGHGATIVRLK